MIACKNITMAELAQDLQRMAGAYMDHPVVDAMGLAGGWDFAMGWTPKAMLQQAPPPSNPNAQPGELPDAPEPGGLSVFESMAPT